MRRVTRNAIDTRDKISFRLRRTSRYADAVRREERFVWLTFSARADRSFPPISTLQCDEKMSIRVVEKYSLKVNVMKVSLH